MNNKYHSELRSIAYHSSISLKTPEALMAALIELTPEKLEACCREAYITKLAPTPPVGILYSTAVLLELFSALSLKTVYEIAVLLLPVPFLFFGYFSTQFHKRMKGKLEHTLSMRSILVETADYLYYVESVYDKYQRKLIEQVEGMIIDGKRRGELILQKESQLDELMQLLQELKVSLENKPEVLDEILKKASTLKDELDTLNIPVTAIKSEFMSYIEELRRSRAAIEQEVTLPNKLERLQELLSENKPVTSEAYDATGNVVHDETAIKYLVHGIVSRIQAHVRQVTEHYKNTPFSALGSPTVPLLLREF